MVNRLATATSPYLLQHAQNPVDWWEWGDEAFAEARRRNVPVLLSVGYAACHWCHVMAHESFEDDATAAFLNEHYVSIKVDREERPDVDAVYMNATQAMTGHGGWPMTCVLDHDGAPFFAGTYFPDQPRQGSPSFGQVLAAIADAWVNRPDDIARASAQISAHLAREVAAVPQPLTDDDLDACVTALANEFDPMAGGFGGAPKFPPSMVLEFLRRYAGRVSTGSTSGYAEASEEREDLVRQARHMLARTAYGMAGSGMYDQLGGGFARYAVDRGWVVPHFEKMLYDNAQLLGLYARLGTPTGDRIAAETADFLLRELRTAEGGFASALDADTEGEEGKFYAWTPAQLVEALGVSRGEWAAELLSVTEEGTFEHGTSTLQLRHEPQDPHELARWREIRARLFDARELRVRPHRDDKVVAAWNGLAISGLCTAGTMLRRPEYVEAARVAGQLLLDVHLVSTSSTGESGESGERRLRRVSRDGVVGRPAAVLEDLGCVASGFLDLLQATGDVQWLDSARLLLDDALDRFRADDGGFHDTASDAESLVARPRELADNASPCGQSAMVHALVTFAALTGEGRYRQAAEETLAVLANVATRAARAAGWALAAAEAMRTGPVEVAVVGPAGPDRDALEDRARRIPGAVVLVADGPRRDLPLLEGRTAVDGRAAAYVCRNLVCERPVTDPVEMGQPAG